MRGNVESPRRSRLPQAQRSSRCTRILASVLALLVVVATLGRVRVNWTGTRTAEDASGERSAAVVRDRDAR